MPFKASVYSYFISMRKKVPFHFKNTAFQESEDSYKSGEKCCNIQNELVKEADGLLLTFTLVTRRTTHMHRDILSHLNKRFSKC